MPDLAAQQRRFFEVVTAGAAPPAGLVRGSPDRVAIYAGMYRHRLHEVLREDYPKLAAVLGVQFDEVATRYLAACPPCSFTLREAGARLPDFLAGTSGLAPWCADLARLERARVEAFDGPDTRVLRRADLAKLAPEQFAARALEWVGTATVIAMTWAVDELWSALEDGRALVEPCPRAGSALVWRRDVTVVHRTLDPDEAALAPLVARGSSLAELCALLPDDGTLPPDHRAIALLLRWLDAEALAR
ncbi:MAG: DNA-binding domain-containing protein [Myxococcota bacterium]|nr:DNA-binding domain-containing protein [Myxococcota bacterium]